MHGAYFIKANDPKAEIHWAVRKDLASLLAHQNFLKKIWTLDRNEGFKGLLNLARELRAQNFTHIYDAHNNLRSRILCWFLKSTFFVRRSKNRLKRLLLFKFGINLFGAPFVAAESFVAPIKSWFKGEPLKSPTVSHYEFSLQTQKRVEEVLKAHSIENFMAFAPGAAWPMKRWPLTHWKNLIRSFPDKNIVLLGGPEDHFCKDLVTQDSRTKPIVNLAGQLSLEESCAMLARSEAFVSADTGLMHFGDLIGVKGVALIGPTAFGYPTRSTTKVAEVNLDCKPCSKDGRGKCRQSVFQKCLVDLTPDFVKENLL